MQHPQGHATAPACHRLTRGAFSVDLLPAAADDAAFTPPEWVHLIPAGVFSGRDGRGPYRLDADAVIKAFAAHGADLPIDYEHQSLSAEEKAGPVPAAGWIKEIAEREDGIWARVEWTPAAAHALTNKEYRYLSPVFRHDKTGRVVALEGAGLTHNPNLYLKAAASRKETDMTLPESVAALLGVPADCDEQTAVAACQALIDQAETAAQARQIDPAEYVPVAMHKQVADQLAALQAQIAAEKAEAAVLAAMRAGKLAPAMKDWAISYASKDPEGFGQWCEKAPAILPPEGDRAAQRVAPNADTLTGITQAPSPQACTPSTTRLDDHTSRPSPCPKHKSVYAFLLDFWEGVW
ncbi:MAG: hypothetical protein Fur0034_20200 [Desulfuromonadia bacterium]